MKAWAKALGTDDDFDLVLELQDLGQLIVKVHEWVVENGPGFLQEAVRRHAPTWSACMSTALTGNVNPADYRVSQDSRDHLGSISALMDAQSVARSFTTRERREALEGIRALRDEVLAGEDLPADLKTAILDRLRDVEAALETWSAGGDDALAAALERMAGVVTMGIVATADKDGNFPTVLNRVAQITGRLYQALATGVTLREGAQLALFAGESAGWLPPGTAGALGP